VHPKYRVVRRAKVEKRHTTSRIFAANESLFVKTTRWFLYSRLLTSVNRNFLATRAVLRMNGGFYKDACSIFRKKKSPQTETEWGLI
jgi:hypothetical protein